MHLPPLRLLSTFDEVVRAGSMREAAARLNVTQPAVTQALKTLEDHVGAQLFDRRHRPARLTQAGERLSAAVREGLGRIEAAIEEIRASAAAGDRLTVACTLGMATYWLMPRLPGFYARHPEMVVNVQAPPTDLPDLLPGIDIALRYGRGGWTDGETVKLFDETVCPVGRPALLRQLLEDGTGLAAAPLIHVRSREAAHWAGWEEYLRARGLPPPAGPGQVFDNYVQAVQAALDGRGLMLGWRSITAALVAEAKLAPWPDAAIGLGTGYYATLAPRGGGTAAEAFLGWLRMEEG